MSSINAPKGCGIVRSKVVAPGTDSTPEFEVRIIRYKFKGWRYRIELIARDEDGTEEVLDAGLRTKTQPKANLCLAAMWHCTAGVLGRLGLYTKGEKRNV